MDQRLLLLPPPAFDLALGGGSVVQPFKMLMKHQLDWSTESCVAIVDARLMPGHACLQAADRRPDVV